MKIDFDKMGGLVPAIIQDATTRNVLMLGFMNEEAYQKTLDTKHVTFWSRTRNTLWTKGETSGHYLNLVDMKIDCDNDTLLVRVNPHATLAPTPAGAKRIRCSKLSPCCSSRSYRTSSTAASRKCLKARTPRSCSATV